VATRMFDRRPAAALGDPHERVAAIVARHGELLTRVARGSSLCADDAQDAVQRALEIYMRRVDSLDPATELAWMKVVVKHEALAVRRGRASVAAEEIDLDAVPALGQRSVEERLESAERVERSAEVMRRLKRDEARALMLKAEGLSYVEIGERLGWTYTNTMSSLALFIALGGTSYALTLPRNSVGSAQIRTKAVGPSEIRTGAVRSRDVRNRSVGVQDLSMLARESLRGRTGPTGPPGPPGPTYRAAIQATGGIGRGDVRGSEPRGLNEFVITFYRNVDDCVSTATLATVEGEGSPPPPPGRITVAREGGSVLVRTFNAAGDPQRLPFHLIVAC
jgi:RNA polymerase sigma factor (sigma-70 family)